MRSKIGTKSRLAAHILALFLLILLLVHGVPATPEQTIPPRPPPSDAPVSPRSDPAADAPPAVLPNLADSGGTLDRIQTPAGAEALPPGQLRPPAEPEPEPEPESAPEPEPAAEPDPVAVERPAEAAEPTESAEPIAPESGEPQPTEPPADAEEPEPVAPEDAPESAPAETEERAEPATQQPDESGAMVVAAPDEGADTSVPAATPLPDDVNLEVLGDGVYWLDSGYDLDKELAAIPEIGSLVFLAPLPEYRSPGLEHVTTEVIAADVADLSADAAARYLHAVAVERRPVVTVVLPGARGAAFFKGAYLLANRKLDMAEVLRGIEAELDEAGPARDEIVHRLTRLGD